MTNVTPEIAGLKRKHAATQEPAKRAELANLLRAAGHDPDAVETASSPSVAPVGRVSRPLVTTEAPKPDTTADVAPEVKETSNESEAKTAPATRRPGRPRKTETTK
ncbi:MAG: hypothetical protein ACREHG_06995 [Candidatus Saccharimonadales bacterium]